MAKKKASRKAPGRKANGQKTVNWYVDTHYALKMKRDALLAKVNEVKQELQKIEDEALHRFGKEGIEGARGAKALGFIEERDHFNVEDRTKLDAYVKKTGHFELFQNRVSAEAVRELLAQGKKPAGIGTFTSVHFRTRKR